MKTSRTVVGVDTAKRVFQLHWVDMETGEIVDLKLTRAKFLEHFANRVPCVVAMEACGGSQHWARQLREIGHDPWLLPAKAVRPFVAGNKNDAHDARAIWTAAQMPGVRTVAVKSEEQQAILALHRMRQQLVKFRTAQINGLRGLLTEYGEVMPQGRAGMRRGMAEALGRVSERLPAIVVDTLREQWARVARLDEEIGEIERRIGLWHRGNTDSRRIAEIPGVGVLTATAVVAAMGDPAAFRSGREFAAWLGLVPRHEGKDWMQAERRKLSRHSPVAKAMDYMLRRWDRFARFLDDGRICLTNNAAERALRGIALGRKSWLFCGSDRGGVRAAAMYTLIGTAKLNNVDPQAWLADVLGKIAGTPQSQLDELLPWNWQDNRRHDRAA